MSARSGSRSIRLLALAVAVLLLPAVASCAPPQVARAERSEADMAPKTRVLAWTGDDRLWLAVPAHLTYVQGPDNKVTITGPTSQVDRVVIDGGTIRYADRDNSSWWTWWRWNRGWHDGQRLEIQLVAPKLTAADVSGSGRLQLGKLSQDRLDLGVSGSGLAEASGAVHSVRISVSGSGGARLDGLTATDVDAGVSGSGWIKSSGSANTVNVSISGSGSADMGELAVQDAQAHISGSGSATLAPKQSADVGVSGSGHVRLETEPAHLTTHKSGSGSISHPGGSIS